MTEYNGFKYGLVRGKWVLQFPSGYKSCPPNVTSEEEMKQLIDDIVNQHGS